MLPLSAQAGPDVMHCRRRSRHPARFGPGGRFGAAVAALTALGIAVTAAAETDLKQWIAALPEGGWGQASLNEFSEAWVPAGLRPLDANGGGTSSPGKIIGAWGGFAWDDARGDLVLWGGGHADYPGNEVYRWQGATRRWQRASLPSEIRRVNRDIFVAADGSAHAPAAAHPYANTVYLPRLDRVLVLGGAAYNNGGAFMTPADDGTLRRTGPYLWNPAGADGNKVGGSTGSNVRRGGGPAIAGGQMWVNRDLWLHPGIHKNMPRGHVNGCAARTEENGADAVYLLATPGSGTDKALYRYVIHDLATPATDRWQRLGRSASGPQGQTVCAIDPRRRHLLRLGSNRQPFLLWPLPVPGAIGAPVTEQAVPLDGSDALAAWLTARKLDIRRCGLDFSPPQDAYALWCGGAGVWWLHPPPGDGGRWTARPASSPSRDAPADEVGVGVLGKWRFAADLGVFIALQDKQRGHVWMYKPGRQ
ncbi:hypothetical protein [Pseudorhodoferax sp.]|uniref:hypothetical protein n=1 Tax=Pseudorhodoferax sp. TaxID=1993553 RepID=UPI002DD6803D|nr:hypothetical protein [Pseudorhodoferax sp.]